MDDLDLNWCVIKSYVNEMAIDEIRHDKALLAQSQIPSHLKTAGVTSLFVPRTHEEQAAEILFEPADV